MALHSQPILEDLAHFMLTKFGFQPTYVRSPLTHSISVLENFKGGSCKQVQKKWLGSALISYAPVFVSVAGNRIQICDYLYLSILVLIIGVIFIDCRVL